MVKNNDNYKWLALSCTTMGALLSVLNSSTLIIALPVIARELHASMELVVWTLMIYMLVITVLVPAIGRVADIIGRKKLFVAGFALFTVASALCGLVNSGVELLLARTLQSVGAALTLSTSTTIVADAFSDGGLGQALGINGMVISAGSVIGPIIGGFLCALNWRWIFFFNLPLGVVGTIWAWAQMREVVELPKGQHFDWRGATLFTAGLGAGLWGITFGNVLGWKTWPIITSLVLGAVLLLVFVWVELRTDEPMLDFKLFRQRLLAAAYSCNFLNGVARGAVTFLLVFYF